MCSVDGPHGEVWTTNGDVTNTNFRDEPGKFYIKLKGFSSDYYILALGEIARKPNQHNKDIKQYAWAVMSDSIGGTLFIYARDVIAFQQNYEQDVLQLVKERGFVFPTNKPIKTYQSTTECEYRSEY